jgi:hypothetical protein
LARQILARTDFGSQLGKGGKRNQKVEKSSFANATLIKQTSHHHLLVHSLNAHTYHSFTLLLFAQCSNCGHAIVQPILFSLLDKREVA